MNKILCMLNLLRYLILNLVTFHGRAGDRRIWRAKGHGPGLSTTDLPTDVTVFWLPSIVKGQYIFNKMKSFDSVNLYSYNHNFKIIRHCFLPFRYFCIIFTTFFNNFSENLLLSLCLDLTITKFWRSRVLPEHRVLTVHYLTNKFRVEILWRMMSITWMFRYLKRKLWLFSSDSSAKIKSLIYIKI